MATYITLISYTQAGLKSIKDLPTRLEAARQAAAAAGASIGTFYLTMGQYDAVAIAEAPDDATVARLLLTVAGQGNITTQTMRAFTEAEATQIVSGL